ncbi:hypothetical protein EHEL_110230 [Encephalitozoon hellem ATCC 50504]|nr:uncharacterized protein EHEL_110230 [Encephalitozoon hellem ATCC 50504]AFM99298.1 hypothetical protein EHEL_110230 [Encephalitozoon hellem ATCC 50504]WEL39801.1 hypothetical protein PFJ87_11g00370 [Encephalitozoon hellem]|eukprot:XP_003888279.1 hypothetical protein EHEL_110230 [Encephalitozoon hellem ATCC 50504]
MTETAENALWISKLDLEQEPTNGVYFSLDIMRCKICFEIFYVKYHEDHPCFSKDIDSQCNQKIETISSMEKRDANQSLEEDQKGLTEHIRRHAYLEEALNIKPVVNKIWRFPHILLLEERKYLWKWMHEKKEN